MRLCIFMLVLCSTVVRAEEPIMLSTQDNLTISQWIIINNPPCEDWNKQYTGYSKLATDPNKECKRYRPWVCISSGNEGVDIEPLPYSFCKGN